MDVIAAGSSVVERESFGEHFRTNCFLVHPAGSDLSLVIDPGQGALAWVADRLAAVGREPAAVLVTHGHMDHTWDVYPVTQRWPVPVYAHRADHEFLARPESALAAHFPGELLKGHPRRMPADLRDVPTGPVMLAGVQITAHHTPGHTPGSTSFVIGTDPAVVATGDTVLDHGPGPVFPPLGDHEAHSRSLSALDRVLETVAVVLPGHGRCVEPQSYGGLARMQFQA